MWNTYISIGNSPQQSVVCGVSSCRKMTNLCDVSPYNLTPQQQQSHHRRKHEQLRSSHHTVTHSAKHPANHTTGTVLVAPEETSAVGDMFRVIAAVAGLLQSQPKLLFRPRTSLFFFGCDCRNPHPRFREISIRLSDQTIFALRLDLRDQQHKDFRRVKPFPPIDPPTSQSKGSIDRPSSRLIWE